MAEGYNDKYGDRAPMLRYYSDLTLVSHPVDIESAAEKLVVSELGLGEVTPELTRLIRCEIFESDAAYDEVSLRVAREHASVLPIRLLLGYMESQELGNDNPVNDKSKRWLTDAVTIVQYLNPEHFSRVNGCHVKDKLECSLSEQCPKLAVCEMLAGSTLGFDELPVGFLIDKDFAIESFQHRLNILESSQIIEPSYARTLQEQVERRVRRLGEAATQ